MQVCNYVFNTKGSRLVTILYNSKLLRVLHNRSHQTTVDQLKFSLRQSLQNLLEGKIHPFCQIKSIIQTTAHKLTKTKTKQTHKQMDHCHTYNLPIIQTTLYRTSAQNFCTQHPYTQYIPDQERLVYYFNNLCQMHKQN